MIIVSGEGGGGSGAPVPAVVARLCHDFAGPLGTLAAGLDWAGRDPEALALAREAAATLSARVRLYRTAWAGGEASLADLLPGLPNADKLDIDTEALGPLDGEATRTVANILLLGAFALPRGGRITVAPDGKGGLRATIGGTVAAWPSNPARHGAWPTAPREVATAVCWAELESGNTPIVFETEGAAAAG